MTNGWQVAKIGEVAKPIERAEEPQAGTIYRQVGVRLWGQGAYERESIDGSETKYKTLSRIESGDIIVNKIWARNGSVAVVSDALAGCFGSGEFPTFAPDRNKLEPKWFHWITKTRWFWEACDEKSQGTSGKNRIRPEKFLDIEIPLPPLTEQRRIVAHIESLAARVNEAQRLREEADYESSVLHGAFAAKLLNEISNAPKHNIGDICEVRGGIQKSPARLPGANPVPYLTVAHVQRNHIDVSSETRYFDVLPEELPRWKLEIGDLLIIEGNGSADQIGRVALYHGELGTCVHQNHVIRARPNTEIILSEYLNMYLNSPLGQDEVQKRSRTTSGLRTLSVGRIREIEIPVPPLDEQRRIVAYLDGLQAKVNELRELQAQSQEELNALLPSVLDKAFKGEL